MGLDLPGPLHNQTQCGELAGAIAAGRWALCVPMCAWPELVGAGGTGRGLGGAAGGDQEGW